MNHPTVVRQAGDTMTKVIKILKVKKGVPTKIIVEGQTYILEPQPFGVREKK